jgi:hypothetical protein
VAIRKITRSHSQVKRLTIDMPMSNYLHDTCQTLIRRITDREQLQTMTNQFVLEFGDKRLRPQRTLASYGLQHGDLLFLFNPDQRLSFLAYNDDDDDDENNDDVAVDASAQVSSSSLLPDRTSRLRNNSSSSSTSDIRTATSTEINNNRRSQLSSPISDHDNYTSSLYSSQ